MSLFLRMFSKQDVKDSANRLARADLSSQSMRQLRVLRNIAEQVADQCHDEMMRRESERYRRSEMAAHWRSSTGR